MPIPVAPQLNMNYTYTGSNRKWTIKHMTGDSAIAISTVNNNNCDDVGK
jgi:hypothetical protein